MTAIGPYSQSYMMTHMYSTPDLRVCQNKGKIVYDKSSIMGILDRTPIYSKFARILQIAQMDGVYNQLQANFTLFVTPDSYVSDDLMKSIDVGDARRIVKSSSLKGIIPSVLIEDSPATYFMTTDERTKLFVTNLRGETLINDGIRVIEKDIRASNGMIHTINNVIIPYM